MGVKLWSLSLTLREEHRLRLFENRVLGEIFGLKGVEITGDWKRLHNVQLYGLYSPSIIIRMMKPRKMR